MSPDDHRSRVEPSLAARFEKSESQEEFLAHMNEVLADFDSTISHPPEREWPLLFIVGVPRSGTTLLHQLIVTSLEVGYVNNLIAAFWRAPNVGIRLSRKLLGDEVPPSRLSSEFGRTTGIHEPHEFGYFWSEALGYGELTEESAPMSIDWDDLRSTLLQMAQTAGKPMAFKAMLTNWHVDHITQAIPEARFVWIRRDPFQTAVSLIESRSSFLGSSREWFSLKPLGYQGLQSRSVEEQVAFQVMAINRRVRDAFESIDSGRVFDTEYESLCLDPVSVMNAVRDMLTTGGTEVAWRHAIPGKLLAHRRSIADTERLGIDAVRLKQWLKHYALEMGADSA